MKARFVTVVNTEAEADYSRHGMHFKYLHPTEMEYADLVEQAKRYSLIRYKHTEIEHEEYGSFSDTEAPKIIPLTELNDFVFIDNSYYYVEAGTVIVDDGKIIGVAMTCEVLYVDSETKSSYESKCTYESGRQTNRETSTYKLVKNENNA